MLVIVNIVLNTVGLYRPTRRAMAFAVVRGLVLLRTRTVTASGF
jgi:hypothetical protein